MKHKNIIVTGSYADNAGNAVLVSKNTRLDNIQVSFRGKNNTIIIDEYNTDIKDITVEFVSHNSVVILGKNPLFRGRIRLGHDSLVLLGDNITTTNKAYINCTENTTVIIGDDCMLSSNIHIRTDDAHAIYDVESGYRLNKSKDVFIGAHTWISFAAKIYGGSVIGDGSIIGVNSFVKGKFPNNCTLGGIPARILRENVAWERPNLSLKKLPIKIDNSKKSDAFWNKTDLTRLEVPYLGEGILRLQDSYKKYELLRRK